MTKWVSEPRMVALVVRFSLVRVEVVVVGKPQHLRKDNQPENYMVKKKKFDQLVSDKKQVPHRLFIGLHKTRHSHQRLEETGPGRRSVGKDHGGYRNSRGNCRQCRLVPSGCSKHSWSCRVCLTESQSINEEVD